MDRFAYCRLVTVHRSIDEYVKNHAQAEVASSDLSRSQTEEESNWRGTKQNKPFAVRLLCVVCSVFRDCFVIILFSFFVCADYFHKKKQNHFITKNSHETQNK